MAVMMIISLLLTCLLWTSESFAATIGRSGDKFTIDGRQKFLLGVSYFDSVHWHAEDLDGLQQRGFNLIRIFLDWRPGETDGSNSAFDEHGHLIHEHTIRTLIQAANARGIMVDVTILHVRHSVMSQMTSRRQAIRSAVSAFGHEPNVFFDLINEHDDQAESAWANSHDVVTTFLRIARAEDADAILFVSGNGDHHIDFNEILQTATIDEELAAGVQVLAPHFPRTHDWWDKTDQRVTHIKAHLTLVGRSDILVYVQEENRHGLTWPSTAAEFRQAAIEARDAGAAGWVLHTSAGFNLAAGPLFNQLNAVESEIVDTIGAVFDDTTPPAAQAYLTVR